MDCLNILLIEDDEDDYILIRDSLSDNDYTRYDLEWVRDAEDVEIDPKNHYDACLLDYRLGIKDGLAVLKKLKKKKFNAPIIMLTGHGNRELDMDAMKLGADDYIEKDLLDSNLLERSIRYSIDRWQNIKRLKESERELRRLSVKILQTQEDERKYIAKELHDSIGSNLTAIKLMLEASRSAFVPDSAGSGFSFDKILSTVVDTIEETQRITKNLRPEALDRLGIVKSIQSLARQFSEINKNIEIEMSIGLTEESVAEHLKITIFRVAQEALNNIAKHSGADHVHIQFADFQKLLKLEITDNGKGFRSPFEAQANPECKRGTGLYGMRERVELTDGRFEVISEIGNGTTVRAFWASTDGALPL
ncbi:MAG: response regulator [Desulfobacterales bacterium]